MGRKLTVELVAEKMRVVLNEYEQHGNKQKALRAVGSNNTYYDQWCEMYPLFKARMEELETKWTVKRESERIDRLQQKKDKLIRVARDCEKVKDSLCICQVSGTEINDWVNNDINFRKKWFEIFPLLDEESRKAVFLREFEAGGRISYATKKAGGSINWYKDQMKKDMVFANRFIEIAIKCADEGKLGKRWPDVVMGIFKESQSKFMNDFMNEYRTGDKTIIECIIKINWSQSGYYYAYKTNIAFRVAVDNIHRMRLEVGVTRETSKLLNGVGNFEQKRRQKAFLDELYEKGCVNDVDWEKLKPTVETDVYEMRKIDPEFAFQWMRVILLCRIEGRLPEKGNWRILDYVDEFWSGKKIDIKFEKLEFTTHSIARYLERAFSSHVVKSDVMLNDVEFIDRMCVRIWKMPKDVVVDRLKSEIEKNVRLGVALSYDQVVNVLLNEEDFSKAKETERRISFVYVYDGIGVWVVEKSGVVVNYFTVENEFGR